MEGRQASHFLSNMPEEILEMIFSFLDQPRDLVSVAGTTAQFRRIVNRTMPKALFSEVFPLIISKLEGDDILNCRLVCKRWTNVVDKYLQTNPVMRAWEPYPYHPTKANECMDIHLPLPAPYVPYYHPHLVQKGLRGPIFSTSADVLNFMVEMEHHPRNPFTMCALDLANDLSLEPDPEFFWDQVEVMLATFGQHIWQLQIGPQATDDNRDVILQCYMILQRMLQYLPNLRLLSVWGFDCHSCPHSTDMMLLFQLKQYIAANPLPELPHLHTFEGNLPDIFKTRPVVDEVMRRYSSQLKTVDLDFSMWSRLESSHRSLPNLTDLRIDVDVSTVQCIHLFRTLQLPQIGKLFLTLNEPVRILKILKSFAKSLPTLTYLKLLFNAVPFDHMDDSTSPEANFRLESVKTLEVFENDHAVYQPMIVVMPALEHILITCSRYIPPNAYLCLEEIEIVTGFMHTNSNIWEKLKALKEFTFIWLIDDEFDLEGEILRKQQFTREMYERSRKTAFVKK